MVHPAEGRAPHARRMARVCARHIPGRPPASRPHRVEMDCHGASSAFQSGRGDRAPPRKPPSAPSPGFPLRRPSHRLAILWRGGLRTPGREGIGPIQMFSPLGHQPFARPSVIMTSPGLRPARTCGRGDRAPPRKPPSAPSPGLPPLGHPSLDGPPAEGRAPHARGEDLPSTRGMSPLGHQVSVCPSMIISCLGFPPASPRERADRVPPAKPPFALSPTLPR